MGSNYQLRTSGYTLPHNIYMQTLYIIKDYHRLKKEREDILFSSVYNDGQPRGNNTSHSTEDKGVKLAMLSERVEGIDRAAHDVGACYANKIKRDDVDKFDCLDAFADYGYFCYVLYNPEKDREPSTRTWKRFRAMLAWHVARNLKLIF